MTEQSLFDACFELPPSEQDAYLERECPDAGLRDRVRRLLAAHARAERAMPDELVVLPADAAPDVIDGYELIGVLGEGGMGVVYEAEQRQPISRRVALKLVKLGMDTRQVVARFMGERQALAAMDHPFVAKVFDAGQTVSGRPYFVMELVPGEPLLQYCERAGLTTRQRVSLFIRICQAVQHAHQKGVIHRDLKPSNLLVSDGDAGPVPKVIDFGIAKAIGRDSPDAGTDLTRAGQALGTPAYMSPEQAGYGDIDIDTRTDVYSLGVILYELLTGLLPIDPKSTGEGKFLAMLSSGEIDPPRPSTRARAPERRLAGDLDWIVMKALEVDRARRYATAAAMADDLTRYLNDEPVAARPPALSYRAGKFVRRHRVQVVAAALVALALVGGAIAATIGLVRANRAEARARQEAATSKQISEFLTGLFAASDPNSGATTLRELLDRGAKRIDADLSGQPRVQASLSETFSHVYGSLALHKEAVALAEKSLALDAAAGVETDQTSEAARTLGRALQQQGQFARAKDAYDKALAIRTRGHGDNDLGVARILNDLGSLYGQLEQTDQAIAAHSRALEVQQRLRGPEHVSVTNSLTGLAILHSRKNDFATALRMDEQVLAIRQKTLGDQHDATTSALENVAWDLKGLKRVDEARTHAARVLEIRKAKLGPDHPQLAFTYSLLGELAEMEGKPDAALASYMEALRIREAALGPDNPRTGDALRSVGVFKLKTGSAAEAHKYLSRALRIYEKAYRPGHSRITQTTRTVAEALERSKVPARRTAGGRK
jgi:serine/threonine protein kinase/Tfp pilus assembly protein PilF